MTRATEKFVQFPANRSFSPPPCHASQHTNNAAKGPIAASVDLRHKGKMDKLESVLVPLGTGIRKRRKAKHLTQTELAASAGLHRTFIAHVEGGVRNVSIMTLVRIAAALGTSVSALCSVLPKPLPSPPLAPVPNSR
jgi:DNA-binding XRE family transcriptional regulator